MGSWIKSLLKKLIVRCTFGRIIYSLPQVLLVGNEKYLSLTFDDGPVKGNTSELLDVLKLLDIKATFFLIGKEIESNPEIVKKIIADGHTVGIHGYAHLDARKYGWRRYVEDIDRSQRCLEKIEAGLRPKYFRPPYGSMTLLTTIILLAKGYHFVLWNADSFDSQTETSSQLIKNMSKMDLRNGDILLFHDDYSNTVKSIEIIINDLKGRGFDFLPFNTNRQTPTSEA